MFKKIIFLYIVLIFTLTKIKAQVEYEPLSNQKVYSFLEKMFSKNIINYNISSLPLSRKEINKLLINVNKNYSILSLTDKKILNDLIVDFEIENNDSNIINITNNFLTSFTQIFDNYNKKYLYRYKDNFVNFNVNTHAFISFRNLNDYKKSEIGLGALGLKLRGTLYDELGFYLKLTTAQQISGKNEARKIFSEIDPFLSSTRKFVSDKYVDRFEGYLRYQIKDYFGLTLGRENLTYGYGFYNKLFISNISAPFDYLRLDLHHGAIYYSFIYGNLRGDSLGKPLENKHIITHRLDLKFNKYFNFGFWEAVITPNNSISFNFLNPVSFLRTASYSSEEDNEDNLLMGIDFLSNPFKNTILQFSFLIDDLNFSTLFKEKRDNKFAYQVGFRNYDFLGVDNLYFTAEYIKITPFIYTHRSNKSTYSHWGINIGPNLNPNSDEIKIGFNYWVNNRINFDININYQRHADGIIYDGGNIKYNFGGNLLNGDGDLISKFNFLEGDRKDFKGIEINLRVEPIKQLFVDFYFFKKWLLSQKGTYQLFYLTLSEEI